MHRTPGDKPTPPSTPPIPSPSGLDLDPDPVDSIELHRSQRNADLHPVEAFFSRMFSAVREAFSSVVDKFFSSNQDAEPVIHISKPRNPRRNEDKLPTDLKKANDAARNAYYAKYFRDELDKDGKPIEAPGVPVASAPTPLPVAEEKPAEPHPGEKTFGQFCKLFMGDEGMAFTPGYFAFTPECLIYAKQVAQGGIGKNVDSLPNAAEIRAAKALLNAESEIRRGQEEAAAREARALEKLTQAEALRAKAPGQADFEKFFEMYQQHKQENTPFILVENSVFLSPDCRNYAEGVAAGQSAGHAEAANYLWMWNANPVVALQRARQATTFELPPPPSAPRQAPRAPIVAAKPAWETQARDLPQLDDSARMQLSRIFQLRADELNQALEGLRLAADLAAKPAKAASAASAAPNRPALSGMPPDSNPTDIDALQQAKMLLAKARLAKEENRLANFPAAIADVLESGQTIEGVIDRRLGELLRKPVQPAADTAFKLPTLDSLSGDEIAAGSADFEAFVQAHANAGKANRVYAIQPGSRYLASATVVIANAFLESVGRTAGLQLNEADTAKMVAAGALVNAARRLGVKKT